VSACGIVTPAPATRHHKGVVFITLEDETGTLNVIVWKSLRETLRAEVLHAGCWRCTAFGSRRKQQRSGYGAVRNLIAQAQTIQRCWVAWAPPAGTSIGLLEGNWSKCTISLC
jgi:DNA polymerase III alpha subunit